MSQTCAMIMSKRSSCALCHCCNQNICRPHLNEHQDLLNSQLNPLADQINTIDDQLIALNADQMKDNCREQLKQWRVDCYRKIDEFFELKCCELDRRIAQKLGKQREETDRVRTKIAALIREDDATRQNIELLTVAVRDLERDMKQLEQISFHVNSRSLVIDGNMIDIEELDRRKFNLLTLGTVFKTISCPRGSFAPLSSNDHYLLIHQAPNLSLMDSKLAIVRQTIWKHGRILNMSWSSTLYRFIIITKSCVFLGDEKMTSIEKAQNIDMQDLFSCTCSDTSLFLSAFKFASFIKEYNLLPSIEFVKQWESPDTCYRHEVVHDMKYNNQTLALLILHAANRAIRIELKNSKTFQRLWSLPLDIEDTRKRAFSFCLLYNQEWLIIDHETCRLLQIMKDGKMRSMCTYNEVPWYANVFCHNILALSTDNGINFHKLY